MNAISLCSGVITTMFAVLTFSPRERPEMAVRPVAFAASEPSLRLDTGWEAAMETAGDDATAFRNRAIQDIEGFAVATKAMSRRCAESRSYLRTRVQALCEHVDYAREELLKLPSSQGDADFVAAHAHFDRTMNGLREAFAQALNEVDDGA